MTATRTNATTVLMLVAPTLPTKDYSLRPMGVRVLTGLGGKQSPDTRLRRAAPVGHICRAPAQSTVRPHLRFRGTRARRARGACSGRARTCDGRKPGAGDLAARAHAVHAARRPDGRTD